jgi:phage baseplate assembly protein W
VSDRLLVPITEKETYDEATLAAFRERVELATEDALATFDRRRELVAYPFDDGADEVQIRATVSSIARWGARLALGLDRNPDRS